MRTTWMAACGPAAVVLTIAGNEMAGSTVPGIDATQAELAAYLQGLDPGWAGLGIEIVGLLALLVFVVHLSTVLRRSDPDGAAPALVLAGGTAAAAIKLASIAPVAAMWLRPEAVDPVMAGLILDANGAAFVLTGAVSALVAGGAAAATVLPRWLRVFGGVTAFALIAGVAGYREEFALGFLLYLIWTIVTGVILMRGRSRTAASPSRGGAGLPRPA